MCTLRAHVLGELRLDEGHLSGASGLARARGRLYVAADDELSLGVFPAASRGPGRRLILAPGALPDDHDARKAAKLDLEAVAALPAGGLLVLGSGSAPGRHRGFVASLDGEDVSELDLAQLHAAIARALGGPVNLEGAEWHAGRLVLAHRGVGGEPSALVRVSWPALAVEDVETVACGTLDGVALGITDLAALPDGRLLTSLSAEDTDNAYDDGAVTGSALAIAGQEPWRLDGPWKVEGIWSDGREVLMVTDADDRAAPGLLLRAVLPR